MHKLLSRQINRNYLDEKLPDNLAPLFEAISQAYDDFENERNLLERSLELVSEELNQRNQELKNKLDLLKETSFQLGDSLAVLDSIFDATGEAILAFDHSGRLVRFNKMAKDILGIRNELEAFSAGQVMRKFLNKLAPEDEFIHQLRKLKLDPEAQLFGVTSMRDRRLYEFHSTPQLSEGKLAGRVWCLRNVTQIKENEALVQYQAFHDSLTELPNRVLFIDRLNHAIQLASREKELLAILFIDLDHFKKVNDTVGHQLGDELLIEVSKRIKSCLREHDTLARFGGDEFVVLLENLKSHRLATQVCKRVNEKLAEPFELDNNFFHISSSIGVSIYPRDDTSSGELIRKADLAMYHAKEKGRDTFEFFDNPLERMAQYQLSIENRLREAFLKQELCVFYQPQVRTEDYLVSRAEALLRWFPSDGPPISPAEFIPVAERAGLINEIGLWVIDQVCGRLSELKKRGREDTKIAVNLSAQQFTDKKLVEQISLMLNKHQIDGKNLELELTESMLVEDLDKISASLQEFRNLDISIAIDDFGTGYSSLKYLQKLPIDIIKIDRSFIQEFSENRNNKSIVNAIISLGQNLNLEVVAEGVEDGSVVEYLAAQGCDFIQGYHFYKPMPGEDLIKLLA